MYLQSFVDIEVTRDFWEIESMAIFTVIPFPEFRVSLKKIKKQDLKLYLALNQRRQERNVLIQSFLEFGT